jgi:hypothetical protein
MKGKRIESSKEEGLFPDVLAGGRWGKNRTRRRPTSLAKKAHLKGALLKE